MDEQTYMARFESMRGSRSKQIIVVHKELDRQCKTVVARHRSDTRITTSELRRQQKSIESRIERMKRELDRCRREGDRNRRYLSETEQRHRTNELKFAMASGRIGRKQSDAERREEARLEAEALMRGIERLVMPQDTKQRLNDEINAMYGYLWD